MSKKRERDRKRKRRSRQKWVRRAGIKFLHLQSLENKVIIIKLFDMRIHLLPERWLQKSFFREKGKTGKCEYDHTQEFWSRQFFLARLSLIELWRKMSFQIVAIRANVVAPVSPLPVNFEVKTRWGFSLSRDWLVNTKRAPCHLDDWQVDRMSFGWPTVGR